MSSSSPPTKRSKKDSWIHGTNVFDAELETLLVRIDDCQDEIETYDLQAIQENLPIEQKFRKLKKPCLTRRAKIISKIPGFWNIAFSNHPYLKSLLNDKEKDLFQYLIRIEVEEFEGLFGYKIDFFFEVNPYFENEMLTKCFELGPSDIPTSRSDALKWKNGMSLSGNNKPAVNQTGSKPEVGFFNWYNDHLDPFSDKIGEYIKDEFWYNPLIYFFASHLIFDVKEEPKEEEKEEDKKENSSDRVVIIELAEGDDDNVACL